MPGFLNFPSGQIKKRLYVNGSESTPSNKNQNAVYFSSASFFIRIQNVDDKWICQGYPPPYQRT